jgi:rhodanese-related sulfurtransferase
VRRKTIDDLLEEARGRLDRLEPRRAYEAMKEGAILVDTRARDLRERDGSIPGALELPLSVLEWRVDPDSEHRDDSVASLDAHLILICAHGYSSSLAAARLQDMGFLRATDVIGGFEAWASEGLPVARRSLHDEIDDEDPGPG